MLIEYTKNGRRRTVNAKVGKLLIGRGLAREVVDAPETAPVAASPTPYTTRMLQADTTEAAPYGYKVDGTPRKRPGRAAAAKSDEEE